MNEWSCQAGPITNTPGSLLLPFLSPLCPTTQIVLPTPITALIQGPPPFIEPLWFTPNSHTSSEHLPCAQNKKLSFIVCFFSSHFHFRYKLLRSMRMQTLWGKRLYQSVKFFTMTGTMLGTRLNEDLLELMFPKGIPCKNCSKLGWSLQKKMLLSKILNNWVFWTTRG